MINRGKIPSELGWLVDILDDQEERLRILEAPGGTQSAGTVGFLAGLVTSGAAGSAISINPIPNDNVVRYVATSTELLNVAIPTGKCLITASVGEASMAPGGSFVEGFVSYQILDANGATVDGASPGSNNGRFYTSSRLGVSISSGPQKHTINPVTNPGPYKITLFIGHWAAPANTTTCSGTFNDPSLVVQVIGEGVAL